MALARGGLILVTSLYALGSDILISGFDFSRKTKRKTILTVECDPKVNVLEMEG